MIIIIIRIKIDVCIIVYISENLLAEGMEVRVETVYEDAGDASSVGTDGGWVGFETLHAYGRDSCIVAFPYHQLLFGVNRDWTTRDRYHKC